MTGPSIVYRKPSAGWNPQNCGYCFLPRHINCSKIISQTTDLRNLSLCNGFGLRVSAFKLSSLTNFMKA